MKLQVVETLLQKEMDRKEFLLYVGLVMLALTGVSGFLKTLSTSIEKTASSSDFGGGVYGGVQKGERK